jgi:hypothetical protein
MVMGFFALVIGLLGLFVSNFPTIQTVPALYLGARTAFGLLATGGFVTVVVSLYKEGSRYEKE